MEMDKTFPGIWRAAFELAYDNNGINRDRSEAMFSDDLKKYLETEWLQADHSGLRALLYCAVKMIDAWLGTLSQNALNTICSGESEEIKESLSSAPPGTDDLLDGIFNSVV